LPKPENVKVEVPKEVQKEGTKNGATGQVEKEKQQDERQSLKSLEGQEIQEGIKYKVMKKTKLLGVPGRFLEVGDVVYELEHVDEDGMVTVKNKQGEEGSVKMSCLANLVKEWKVIKRAKVFGAPGQYVDAGEIVNEEEPEDEDGMVQIRTKNGVTGAVKKHCLGPKFKTHTIQKRQKLHGPNLKNVYLEKDDVVIELAPEDDVGDLFVKTKDGKEGQIPKSCLVGGQQREEATNAVAPHKDVKEVTVAFQELKVGDKVKFIKEETKKEKKWTLVSFSDKKHWIPSNNIKDV